MSPPRGHRHRRQPPPCRLQSRRTPASRGRTNRPPPPYSGRLSRRHPRHRLTWRCRFPAQALGTCPKQKCPSRAGHSHDPDPGGPQPRRCQPIRPRAPRLLPLRGWLLSGRKRLSQGLCPPNPPVHRSRALRRSRQHQLPLKEQFSAAFRLLPMNNRRMARARFQAPAQPCRSPAG